MKPMDLLDLFGDLTEEDVAWMLQYEPPHKRTPILVTKPFLAGVSAAACLFVTAGLSLHIWSSRQRIEPRPPQETVTILQTETRTETTAQTAAASQTTAFQTKLTQRFTETSAQTVVSLSSAAYPTETHITHLAATIESSKSTSFFSVTSVQPKPLQTSESVSPQQSRTVTISETAHAPADHIPNTERVSTGDIPSTSVAVTTAEAPASSAAATRILPTEPPSIDYETLPGFSVTRSDEEALLQVTWLSDISPTPAEAVTYHAESDRFLLEFAGRIAGNTAYWYDIYDTETGKHVRIQLEERRVFSHRVKANGKLTLQFVGGHPGFQYLDEQQCALFWDNGCYQCSICASPDDQAILLPIAESMQPETASADE